MAEDRLVPSISAEDTCVVSGHTGDSYKRPYGPQRNEPPKRGSICPRCLATSHLRKRRDLNPRNLAVQRFSRPSHSAALPPFPVKRRVDPTYLGPSPLPVFNRSRFTRPVGRVKRQSAGRIIASRIGACPNRSARSGTCCPRHCKTGVRRPREMIKPLIFRSDRLPFELCR